MTLLFTSCGNENQHIIEIDDYSFDLTGDFQDVVGEIVQSDLLVKDIQRVNVCYDENGRYTSFESGIDKASLPACYVMQRPHIIQKPGIIESCYYFRKQFTTAHGIDEKSKKRDIKGLEGFQEFRGAINTGSDAYIAMYTDNMPVDLDSYANKIKEMLKKFDYTEI